MKTYSELITFPTFAERFNYLKMRGKVGRKTFGTDRYLNQRFYRSAEWKRIKQEVLIRDLGMDLGILETLPEEKLIVHHMNPIAIEDIVSVTDKLLNPEYLITVTHNTHNAIHYGDESLLSLLPVERRPGDTCPWKQLGGNDG